MSACIWLSRTHKNLISQHIITVYYHDEKSSSHPEDLFLTGSVHPCGFVGSDFNLVVIELRVKFDFEATGLGVGAV